jgi:F420H(2)-dependent biliverdin reductase
MRRNPARWRALEARLGREMTVWIATVRSDGRPHLTPVWFVWLDGHLYLVTGSETRKFTNLSANSSVALSLPDSERVIILEGEARIAHHSLVDRLGEYFFNKYEWDFRFDDEADWRLIEVTPHRILAWGDGHDDEGIRVL